MTQPTIADLQTVWAERGCSDAATKAATDILADRAWATPHALAAATGASLDQVAAAIVDLDTAREIAHAFVAPC